MRHNLGTRHNLGMSNQNLKKKSGFHIDHKRNIICKNEGFCKKTTIPGCLILTKNGS